MHIGVSCMGMDVDSQDIYFLQSGRGPLLRPLTPDDGEVVKLLSIECFPIQYPDHWFDYILSNKVSWKQFLARP